MEIKITKTPQAVVIYKILNRTENQEVLEYEPHGKSIIGNLYICNNALILKDNDGIVLGVFSLDHYYFIKPNIKITEL